MLKRIKGELTGAELEKRVNAFKNLPPSSPSETSYALRDELSQLDVAIVNAASVGDPPRVPCPTHPDGASFCDGYAHLRRHFQPRCHRWGWAVYEFCPVATAANEQAKQKTIYRSRWAGDD